MYRGCCPPCSSDSPPQKHFKLAIPDGDGDQQHAYFDALGTITKAIRRRQMRLAVRRILSEKPFAAISAPVPPVKRVKINPNLSILEPSSGAYSYEVSWY